VFIYLLAGLVPAFKYMAHIDYVNQEMKKINNLTDEIYEAMADEDSEGLASAIKNLHKVLEKITINEKILRKGKGVTPVRNEKK